ncbi:tetratricopeptide repeat protein [Aeromonas hydrophila]|uniref:tetratricopeptide repeat protein n=1 Tax=Aeromonas hydrophila TaxID=644 RepID=UPI0009B90FD9|nr:tetratricopeptide repeat protein [Aeromonas hydrophila]
MTQSELPEAITALIKAAKDGDATAQFELARKYVFGQGIEQSDDQAAEWCRKAAEQGHSRAQFNLGVMYEQGQGVEKNYKKAAEWYYKAAEQKYVGAQFNLGHMYQNGLGVEQNDSKAVEWYSKAAELGDADAQYLLGNIYDTGRGVRQNDSKAIEWYRKAAEQGKSDAQYQLGYMYDMGRGVMQSDSKAFEWYRKAAEQGDPDAQFNLGTMYRKGEGIEQNDSKAVEWYLASAEQGNPDAQYNLGLMHYRGEGLEQNDSKAAEWFRKVAEQGDPDAQLLLGFMYEEGRGVESSDIKAVEWYRKAAEQNDADAQCNLGWMYDEGRGVTQCDTKAVEWYLKATEQKLARAQCNLGVMYIKGRGVEQDYHTAIKWFRKASKGGDEQGSINLGLMYMNGEGVKQNYARAQALFRKAARNAKSQIRFQAIELQDQAQRYALSPQITKIREQILDLLKVKEGLTMTHYTSLQVGNALLLEQSPLRLGHINALNDPNEGKLLWHYLGHTPVESKPAFVGCFLPEEDSLNMWRFYSKDHQKEDACGCAITFNPDNFFEFDLLSKQQDDAQKDAKNLAFPNSGKSPQESAAFYRVVYIKNEMQIHGEEEGGPLKKLFEELKSAVNDFLGSTPDKEKRQDLSWLLGPLPYLLKDADYEAEKEHRVIVTHLEYGAKEIQVEKPDLIKGTPPRLYLELHRTNHLAPVKHVTLGPKSPHQDMMAPYWHHQLASKFPDQLRAKPDLYIKASRCAYQ